MSPSPETWEELLRERVRALADERAAADHRSGATRHAAGTAPSAEFRDARRFLDFAFNRKEPTVPRGARLERLKRTILRVARTFTRPQTEFNAAVVEVLERVLREFTAVHGALAAAQHASRTARTRREERLQAIVQDLGAVRSETSQTVRALTTEQEALRQDLVQLRAGLGERLAAMTRQHDELVQHLGQFRSAMERAAMLAKQHEELRAEVLSSNDDVRESLETRTRNAERQLREQVARLERKVRRLLARSAEPELAPPPTDAGPAVSLPFDYAGFEERFRGSEEEVKRRQREYLPLFAQQQDVVDIGCGRGEFLELLAEVGVAARGVDLDLDMILQCREKGLDVVRADAFAYLAALPDESLGGVFSAQVIEHLEPARVIELVSLCQRKLRAGGRLLLETPNPASLAVFARGFYMDFTHIRPIHPEAMRFLLESTGFRDVRLQFSSPVDVVERLVPFPDGSEEVRRFNRGLELLNELVYGPQDYAVIGTKGGPGL